AAVRCARPLRRSRNQAAARCSRLERSRNFARRQSGATAAGERAPPTRAPHAGAGGRDCCPRRYTPRASRLSRGRGSPAPCAAVPAAALAPASARAAALLLWPLVGVQHLLAFPSTGVLESLPPVGEVRAFAFELAAVAAQAQEIVACAKTRVLEQAER